MVTPIYIDVTDAAEGAGLASSLGHHGLPAALCPRRPLAGRGPLAA